MIPQPRLLAMQVIFVRCLAPSPALQQRAARQQPKAAGRGAIAEGRGAGRTGWSAAAAARRRKQQGRWEVRHHDSAGPGASALLQVYAKGKQQMRRGSNRQMQGQMQQMMVRGPAPTQAVATSHSPPTLLRPQSPAHSPMHHCLQMRCRCCVCLLLLAPRLQCFVALRASSSRLPAGRPPSRVAPTSPPPPPPPPAVNATLLCQRWPLPCSRPLPRWTLRTRSLWCSSGARRWRCGCRCRWSRAARAPTCWSRWVVSRGGLGTGGVWH